MIDMPAQQILYIDMDDVLCNYSAAFQKIKTQQPDIQYPQSIPRFFEQLEPVDHAVQSILDLAGQYTVFVNSSKAELWLNTPLNALSGDTPVARLRTDHGIKEVVDVLRKIESGEFT